MIAVDLRIPTDSRAYERAASIRVRDGRAEFTGRRELFDIRSVRSGCDLHPPSESSRVPESEYMFTLS